MKIDNSILDSIDRSKRIVEIVEAGKEISDIYNKYELSLKESLDLANTIFAFFLTKAAQLSDRDTAISLAGYYHKVLIENIDVKKLKDQNDRS